MKFRRGRGVAERAMPAFGDHEVKKAGACSLHHERVAGWGSRSTPVELRFVVDHVPNVVTPAR
jgi:hypothetical protein